MEASSILRKTVFAGIGVYSLTKEKAQEFINELVEKGELAQDEGPKFVKDMMQKAEDEVESVKKIVDGQVQKAISVLRPTYDEEFRKLNKRIDKLAKDVENLAK